MNGADHRIPAARVRLRMEGMPQDMSETIALVLVAAVKFCAQPERFDAFQGFAVADNFGPFAAALAKLPRAALFEIEALLAAGVVADLEAMS